MIVKGSHKILTQTKILQTTYSMILFFPVHIHRKIMYKNINIICVIIFTIILSNFSWMNMYLYLQHWPLSAEIQTLYPYVYLPSWLGNLLFFYSFTLSFIYSFTCSLILSTNMKKEPALCVRHCSRCWGLSNELSGQITLPWWSVPSSGDLSQAYHNRNMSWFSP